MHDASVPGGWLHGQGGVGNHRKKLEGKEISYELEHILPDRC